MKKEEKPKKSKGKNPNAKKKRNANAKKRIGSKAKKIAKINNNEEANSLSGDSAKQNNLIPIDPVANAPNEILASFGGVASSYSPIPNPISNNSPQIEIPAVIQPPATQPQILVQTARISYYLDRPPPLSISQPDFLQWKTKREDSKDLPQEILQESHGGLTQNSPQETSRIPEPLQSDPHIVEDMIDKIGKMPKPKRKKDKEFGRQLSLLSSSIEENKFEDLYRDNGPSFKKEDVNDILDPYYDLSNKPKRSVEPAPTQNSEESQINEESQIAGLSDENEGNDNNMP